MFIYIIAAVILEMLVALIGYFFALDKIKRYITYAISFSVGTFLGVVFFDLLPETIELTSPKEGALYILGGFLIFFLLSRFLYWHHHHHEEHHRHPKIQTSGIMILAADLLHNFIDGILIVTAFVVDIRLGIITTIAVLLHEIPQEISDFFVLVNAGFSKVKAILFNFIISASTLVGALIAFLFLESVQGALGPILCIAACNFLYLATSDLLPEIIHHQPRAKTGLQVIFLFFGLLVMYLVSTVIGHG